MAQQYEALGEDDRLQLGHAYWIHATPDLRISPK